MNTQETKNKIKSHFQNNKQAWVWSLSVIFGIIIIIWLGSIDSNRTKTESNDTTSPQVEKKASNTESDELIKENSTEEQSEKSTEIEPVLEEKIVPKEEITKSSVLGSNYSKAKAENAPQSIVFGDSCTPSLVEITVPKNTLVFLGNESKTNLTLSLNSKTSQLRPSHYDLYFVGGTGTYKVMCNEAEVASVIVL